MSHQTGITASESLHDAIRISREATLRILKVQIQNEKLELVDQRKPVSTWNADFPMLAELAEPKRPCYLFFRLDSANSSGYEWLMVTWSPDDSSVPLKMLTAATKATLKREFGENQIKEEMFATIPDELSLQGFERHLRAQAAPKPLTASEEEREIIKQTEINTAGSNSKHQLVKGVSFDLDQSARSGLQQFQANSANYVQLAIDLSSELITLANSGRIPAGSLADQVPTENARYHLYRFSHRHDGHDLDSIFFAFSMPGYHVKMKERMIYSSCKAGLLDVLESQMGIAIARKVEIEKGSELSEEFLYNEIHPPQATAKVAFAKPKGPGGRGPRRMHKPADTE